MSPVATAASPGSTARQPRLEPARRHRTRLILVMAAALIVLLGAGWLLLFSSVFAARQVVVTGTQSLTPAQVEAAAAVPMGRPLLRLDLQAIARQTSALPQLASAKVSRSWPHDIQVAVVERKPLLAVAQPEGYLMVDKTGVAYESRSTVPSGVVNAAANPDNRALMTEIGVATSALPASLRTQVRGVSATTPDDITMTLDSGVFVMWGNAKDSALKAQLTAVLLKRHPRLSIDVSSPHTPAVR